MQWSRYILIVIVLFRVQLFCEEQGTGYLEAGLFTDYNNTNARDFIVKAVSPVWDRNCYLTESFKIGSLFQIPEHLWQTSQSTFYKYGWDHCTSPLASRSSVNFDTLGYALYKISCTMDTINCYFYLDWRDDRYPLVGGNDFEINFDDTMSYSRFSYADCGDNPLNWIKLGKGDTVGIWEILDFSSNPSRDRFQPTTPTNLTVSWSNDRPLLTWRCSEPRAAANYEVWRKVMGGLKYLQTIEDWRCIFITNAGDIIFADREFISGNGYKAYYKVRAVSGDGNIYSPDWSNTVSVTGSFTPSAKDQKFRAVEIDPLPTEFCLHPVFPNPFNASTTLKLDLPEETRFSLGIYDIKGCEVWRLNNRQTNTWPAGYHWIVWDGRDNSGAVVPTGVYFIVYHSAERKLTQKVVLMK